MELLHTHIKSHFYTLVPIYFSQIELALRDFNFYSDGTPSKESQCTPIFAKTKENEKKKKKQKKTKVGKRKKNREISEWSQSESRAQSEGIFQSLMP